MTELKEVIIEMLGVNGETIYNLLRTYEKADATDKKILLSTIEKLYRKPNNISVQTKTGVITATAMPDRSFPGIDVEFKPNNLDDYNGTLPRVLFEQPLSTEAPQIFVWEDPQKEDYSAKFICELEQGANGPKTISKHSKEKIHFETAGEMLDLLQDGFDLYSPTIEKYVFLYNESGAIASYNIDNETAIRLSNEPSVLLGECWSGLLGPGGDIYFDEPDSSLSNGLCTAMDFCVSFFEEDWILTKDLLSSL